MKTTYHINTTRVYQHFNTLLLYRTGIEGISITRTCAIQQFGREHRTYYCWTSFTVPENPNASSETRLGKPGSSTYTSCVYTYKYTSVPIYP